jgi:tight adherence protein B
MSGFLILAFLVILATLLFSISGGLRWYEARRRSQLVNMLRTVSENGVQKHVDLLLDPSQKKASLENMLGEGGIANRLNKLVTESGLDWSVTRLLTTSAVAMAVGFIGGVAIPTAALAPAARGSLAGMVAGILPFTFVSNKREKRMEELEAQLPDALDFLARSMRAGHAFSISLEMVGEEIQEPLGQEFRSLFNEQNLGASFERSLANFCRRVPLGDVRFFASSVLLQRQTGGNLGEILNRLSHIMRERFRLKGQVKAVSAHGRLTATILTLLPIATLGGLIMSSPGYLDPLLEDATGRKMVAAGIVAQIVGNFFIRKIIKIKV